MDKDQCQKLFEEFRSLKAKMDYAFQVHDVVPGQPLDIRTAPPAEDMFRYKEVAELLLANCTECLVLDPGELHELYSV
ncbi:hypothetical protein KJ848_03240 [Patescibacteria group bacterium]|nr:hypothetical protein [Patescibacteria group bacterium]MBU2159172.1 hypothetical protein [Patescibacteria group bacterium]